MVSVASWAASGCRFYFDIVTSPLLSVSYIASFPIDKMRARPDLSFPSIPDVEDIDHSRRLVSVENGGTSLRGDAFEWPESGPSESSKVKGLGPGEKAPLIGTFGAKAAAAMSGAMVTSLLSKWPGVNIRETSLTA